MPLEAYAGVTVVQALSFGSWISKNNNAQYDITINTNGSYTFDGGGFIEIAPPQEGVFDIDGLPVNTAIASVVVTQTIPLSASGENFQMISLQEAHPASTTAGGVAQITVGGTARTSGSTISYGDNTYNGQLEIQINF